MSLTPPSFCTLRSADLAHPLAELAGAREHLVPRGHEACVHRALVDEVHRVQREQQHGKVEDELAPHGSGHRREESEELRWLQEKLRAAEMNMQRKLRLDEKAMIKERNEALVDWPGKDDVPSEYFSPSAEQCGVGGAVRTIGLRNTAS